MAVSTALLVRCSASNILISISFVLGVILGSLLFNGAEQTNSCPNELIALLVAFLVAGIGLNNRKAKAIVFAFAFLFAGIARSSYFVYIDTSRFAGFLSWLSDLREWICCSYVSLGLNGDELSVVSAMTLGDKSQISYEMKNMYAESGASHVLALSGMHLSIIYCLLFWTINKALLRLYMIPDILWESVDLERNVKFKKILMCIVINKPDEQLVRNVSYVVILIVIWSYVMLVGMMPSVVRASLMLTIYTFSRSVFRKTNIISVLLLTAFITLLISPESIKDVGFQMSYMAVLGIGLVMPCLYSLIRLKWRITRYVYNLFCLTFSAQIMVAPLSLYYFHRIAIIGFVTGMIVSFTALAIVALAMLVIVLMVVGMTDVAQIVAYLLIWVARLQNVVVEYLAMNF